MITFDCMKTIANERPLIVKQKEYNGYLFEYSDYCFVKNKYGYTIARYKRCKSQNSEWWEDKYSTHPLNENDEWYSLKEFPVFSLSIRIDETETEDWS